MRWNSISGTLSKGSFDIILAEVLLVGMLYKPYPVTLSPIVIHGHPIS